MEFAKSRRPFILELWISLEYYVCSGVTRFDCYLISSGIRRVLGKARLGSSESLGESPAREFGEYREKPGSGVCIVLGKARFGSLHSVGKNPVREFIWFWGKPGSVNMFWE